MPRQNQPRYRVDRDAWVTKINGQLVTLAKGKRNKGEATRELRRLLSSKESGAPPSITVAELFDRLLVWVRENRALLTLEWYTRHLRGFSDHIGRETPVDAVRPFHVDRWLESQEWGQATQHGAITAVKRAFRWGWRKGYLPVDALAGLDRPSMPRRESILSPDEEIAVLEASAGPLRDYLVVIHETGCRPSEVARMEAAHVSGDVVTMAGKSSRKTEKPRSIYLTAQAAEVVSRLVEAHPTGPIFLNTRGRPWTRNALALAMRRVRIKLRGEIEGPKWKACTAESFRHGWVTDAKLKLPNSVVAELAGHTSTAMVDKHYGHVSERKAELAAALTKVRGSRTDTAESVDASASKG